ncbi:MAG: endonuclease III [Actinomycetota bacterium]
MKEDFASKKRRANSIYRVLTRRYPNVHCELDFKTPFQLLVATVLSAQCTDKRVNSVTPTLFKRFPDPRSMAKANVRSIEAIIKPTGFFRTKAGNIKELSRRIVEEFDGEVPSALDDLVTLPGVGRKTANVVLGHAFGIPGITVDTHFGRLSRRFGWSNETDPGKVEFEVGKLIREAEWTNLSQRLIWHGRRICHSRRPACGACPLAKYCPSFGIGEVDPERAERLVKSEEDFR